MGTQIIEDLEKPVYHFFMLQRAYLFEQANTVQKNNTYLNYTLLTAAIAIIVVGMMVVVYITRKKRAGKRTPQSVSPNLDSSFHM